MILVLGISRKIRYMHGLRAADMSHFQFHLFSSHILCVDSISEFSWPYLAFRRSKKLPAGGKNENWFFKNISRFPWVVIFLRADSESTQQVTSVGRILEKTWVFGVSQRRNPVFGQKQDFARSEQLQEFRNFLSANSNSPWSKVPTLERNPVFFLIFKIHYVRHSLPSKIIRSHETRYWSSWTCTQCQCCRICIQTHWGGTCNNITCCSHESHGWCTWPPFGP